MIFALLMPLVGMTASADSLKFVNAETLPLIGKGFDDTQNRYERLPARLQSLTRPPVWNLSKNCSGMAIRFRTNSPVIAARWELTGDVVMNHFTPTGIKGLDLYCMKDGKWQFVNSGRPTGKTTTATIISNMAGSEMEYMLYLPLYDGLKNLEIGVQADAMIDAPKLDSPRRGTPVIFYGTSITQGGCATRAGMAYPNILSRKLDKEIINLGFSGNGQLDLEVAEAMSTINASVFVIDCIPNVTVAQMNEKYVRFLEIIREKHPKTPILLVESVLFTHMNFDRSADSIVKEKNALLKKIYEGQKAKGDKNIYYQKADNLIGHDQEATVDGIHLTDLGFVRLADEIYPAIRKLIK